MEKPVKILTDSEYECSYGTTGMYVEFEYYPQSVMEDNVTIVGEAPDSPYTGFACYKGSDNCYYVKVDSPTLAYDKGDLYSGDKYRNGSDITSDSAYFKIEPIRWRVLDLNYKDVSDCKSI